MKFARALGCDTICSRPLACDDSIDVVCPAIATLIQKSVARWDVTIE